jgi:hypothetical protein
MDIGYFSLDSDGSLNFLPMSRMQYPRVTEWWNLPHCLTELQEDGQRTDCETGVASSHGLSVA